MGERKTEKRGGRRVVGGHEEKEEKNVSVKRYRPNAERRAILVVKYF